MKEDKIDRNCTVEGFLSDRLNMMNSWSISWNPDSKTPSIPVNIILVFLHSVLSPMKINMNFIGRRNSGKNRKNRTCCKNHRQEFILPFLLLITGSWIQNPRGPFINYIFWVNMLDLFYPSSLLNKNLLGITLF